MRGIRKYGFVGGGVPVGLGSEASKPHVKLDMVVHVFNPNTQEEEEGRSLSLKLAWSTEREFQDNQSCTKKPCHEKPPPPTTIITIAMIMIDNKRLW